MSAHTSKQDSVPSNQAFRLHEKGGKHQPLADIVIHMLNIFL